MVRLLHSADWQIGRVYAQFEPDDAAALFEARFRVVERLAALATEHEVHAVLVAGDVFDAQTVADKTLRRLFLAMQGYRGPWFLLPGNHDAALTESVWTRAARLNLVPPNVTACLEAKPHVVNDAFVLLPAPLTQRHTYDDLTDWFAAAATAEGLPRIGLAHGCVQGVLPEEIDSANPIAADRAETAGLAYLALGDWHGTKCIDAKTWYAGTPETDRFKANESGQALLVALCGAGAGVLPEVTALPTGLYRWQQWDRRIVVASDVAETLDALATLGPDDVVHLRVSGTSDLGGHRQLRLGVDAARARARALVWDESALRLEPTQDDLRALRADGYVGEVLAELRAQQEGGDAAVARDALLELARVLDASAQDAGAKA
jgi:DNA repair exonuclease SbcCD nuclease subunit